MIDKNRALVAFAEAVDEAHGFRRHVGSLVKYAQDVGETYDSAREVAKRVRRKLKIRTRIKDAASSMLKEELSKIHNKLDQNNIQTNCVSIADLDVVTERIYLTVGESVTCSIGPKHAYFMAPLAVRVRATSAPNHGPHHFGHVGSPRRISSRGSLGDLHVQHVVWPSSRHAQRRVPSTRWVARDRCRDQCVRYFPQPVATWVSDRSTTEVGKRLAESSS